MRPTAAAHRDARRPSDTDDTAYRPTKVYGRHGTLWAYPSDEFLGEAIIKYGEYGEHEFRLLRDAWQFYPHDGRVIVEVGSNAGYLTVPLMSLGDVIAFEPQPDVFDLLKNNVVMNGKHGHHVSVEQLAVSDEPGTIQCPIVPFTEEHANHGGISMGTQATYPSVTVPCVTLDRHISVQGVKLLKVDVEGMEEKVLRGAVNLIASDQPMLYVENDRVPQSRSLVSFIWSLGYACWYHLPPLYNPDNFFGVKEDLWPGTVSMNMFCLPRGITLPSAVVSLHHLIPITSDRQLP